MRAALLLATASVVLAATNPSDNDVAVEKPSRFQRFMNHFRFGDSKKQNATATPADKAANTVSVKPAKATQPGTTSRAVALLASGGTRCGPDFGKCPGNYCCSQWGWCDVGPEYCGAGCRNGYGRCDGDDEGGDDGGDDGPHDGPSAKVITQCTVPGTIGVTFDDGPAEPTADLLDLLDRYKIKATFFVNGKNYLDPSSRLWKTTVKRAYDAGHQIASHTYEHKNLAELSVKEIERQMRENDRVIKAAIGKRPVYMRPPYGAVSKTALSVLGRLGYKVVNWSIETLDTEHDDADKSTRAYISVLQHASPREEGHIALGHDPMESTAKLLLPKVLPVIRRYGFRPTTLAECLGNRGGAYRD